MKQPAAEAVDPAAARDEIRSILRWVRHALHRHIETHAHRLIQTGGQLNDLFVSLGEARRTLPDGTRSDGTPSDGTAPPQTGLPQAPPAEPLPIGGRLGALRDRFGLSDTELALLAVAVAPALDIELARLYTFAWADFTRKRPSVGFLCELVAPGDPLAVSGAFRADARLVLDRLVQLVDDAGWGASTPSLHRGVTVPQPVITWLLGERSSLPRRLPNAARIEAPDDAESDLALSPGVMETLERVLDRGLDGAVESARSALTLVLVGAPGAGRRSAARAALARRGLSLLFLDVGAVPEPMLADAVADARREARLRGAVLFVRGDALFDDTERTERTLPAVLPHLGRQPTIISARQSLGVLRAVDPFEIRFESLPAPRQIDVWRRALPDPELAEPLVDRFSMPPGAIFEAVRIAGRDAALAAPDACARPDIDGLATAVRQRISHALDVVAEPVTTTLGWDDVVLPDDIMATLQEIRSQALHRSQVYDGWGFRQKVAYGRGLACLFAGPPGTGKTMMATILAADLGREIYRVDLSRVVSKWVGETEKNLSRVFDEAEKAQIILFFDEADSLFSNRTEVKGSNDRFANMEVNYLLQRMEQFDGMSILTTNFERGIDEAFKRRLKFRVQFPLPDSQQRAELWQRCIPPEMPIEDDIRWSQLGRKYKLSGGNIKNAVVRAAFYAAEHGRVLTEALLLKAGDAEMREMGRL